MTFADSPANDAEPYDVAVIGAGVVGCAVARELSIRGARTVLIEARNDVGDATSKANTAILHTGFDAKPGTLESRLVARGYTLLSAYAARAGIPVEVPGALLIAWDQEQLDELPVLAARAEANGYHRTRQIGADELYAREPHLGPGALGALEVPDEGIICPWTTSLAFATEAVRHGAVPRLDSPVTAVTVGDNVTVVETATGPVATRIVVNAAGLGSDLVHAMLGLDGFTITPRRGELIVFDKLARPLVNHVLLPVPTKMGKGVLVAPTVYGNVMLGPTSENLDDRTATGSSEDGLAFLQNHGRRIMPDLLTEEATTIYAGLRAASEHDDYQISVHPQLRYACAGGIRSTGLTSSLAIAEYLAEAMTDVLGLSLKPMAHPEADPQPPHMPNIGEATVRPYADAARIAANPEYGEIVCFCERTTLGEIRDAMRSDIPPRTVEGLRRRTRATMGRCQGFFCGATIRQMLNAPDPSTAAVPTTRHNEGAK
ncbi:NAD(P)/FAD-dependent oxidoreductase [Micromonospora soli]|uniref:NAD(P)/FAD-dependent oxidoreductase n=1 Tax=Micromonospora sp. NBRC 110009 TaxID=3061627 RepID=UPI002671BAC7|nr:NAD(P)/FAD-dependent oxidoreductase [Micromonospora sp. NBRC 110009]WKT98606.1 NAD(P)/FAD-dependent oxidoreductase [Micromonospora sp. NBRC 110009]